MFREILLKDHIEGVFWFFVFVFFLFAIRCVHLMTLRLRNKKKKAAAHSKTENHDTLSIGKNGETEVSRVLSQTCSLHKKLINDIVIKTEDGKMSQIDHILINEAGVFVIETKNYKGAIYGTQSSFHWCQYLSGKKFMFYNPVMQNTSHIKRLKAVLGIDCPYHSVIVFAQNNSKKIEIDHVLDLRDLKSYIDAHCDNVLTKHEIKKIYKRLLSVKKKKYENPHWLNDAA